MAYPAVVHLWLMSLLSTGWMSLIRIPFNTFEIARLRTWAVDDPDFHLV